MDRETVNEKLTDIFRKNFDDDSLVLTDDTTSAEIEDWDSLEQINLVVSIEKAFDIRLNIDEVNRMKNVGKMIDTILEKCKGIMENDKSN